MKNENLIQIHLLVYWSKESDFILNTYKKRRSQKVNQYKQLKNKNC